MLESYDDTGGCAASIISLVGLIAFTVCMWNAYPTNDKQDIEHVQGVKYECSHEYKCACGCGGLDEQYRKR